jgi:hypothetical protein
LRRKTYLTFKLRQKKATFEDGPRGTVIPYNYSSPRVSTNTSTSEGIIKFGDKNDFPNTLIDLIDASPNGTACLNTYIDFLKGDGLTSADLAKAPANSNGDTFASLTAKICHNVGYFEGAYVLVRYNLNGLITEIVNLPYESCRLGNRNDEDQITHVLYNPYYGTKQYGNKKKLDVKYHIFNPGAVMGQIKQEKGTYKGQVLFIRSYQPGKPDYPIPAYYAAIDWFETDGAIPRFHKNNVKNNFLLSVLLKVIGDAGAIGPNSNGKTNAEMLAADLKTNMAGSENGGSAMVLWAKTKEGFPEIEKFPTNGNAELFNSIEAIVTDHIARATKVPPILANIQVAGKLGGSQEILNAADLLKNRVTSKQDMIENIFNNVIMPLADKSLWPREGEGAIPFEISPFTATAIVPDTLLDELTDTEKRELIGYPALEGEEDGKGRLLIEKIGQGGTAALLDVLGRYGASQMTWAQAAGTLKVLFKLRKGQIAEMLGPEPVEPITPPPAI